MSDSQWHKFYTASIGTTPDMLFNLLAVCRITDDGCRGRPRSAALPTSTPIPSALAAAITTASRVSREMTGGARLRDSSTFIYSLGQEDGRTTVTRWLALDISMPLILRPLRRAITSSFERENVRTMAALKTYAEAAAALKPGSVAEESS